MHLYSALRYLLIGFTILILGGLMGWYIYLRAQHSSQAAISTGRGLGDSAPSFTGGMGSNYQNSLSGLARGDASNTPTSSPGLHDVQHVSQSEVAGFGFVSTGTSTTALYFVERATGYVFLVDLRTGISSRIAGTLTPKVYEAYVASDGSVIERYPSEKGGVETVAIAPPAAPGAVARRINLPQDINPFAISADGIIVYGTRSAGATTLWSTNWSVTKTRSIFQSSIASWRAFALTDGRIILAEKAADGVLGHSYTLSAKGTLSPLTPALSGLSVLAQSSSTAILYTSISGGKAQVFVRAGANANTLAVPLATVADKCAWTAAVPAAKKGATTTPSIVYCAVPDAITTDHFLDAWYRGEIHTTDALWAIDSSVGTAVKTAVEWPRGITPPDVIDPSVDPSGTYISFKDARDQSLWLVRLKK